MRTTKQILQEPFEILKQEHITFTWVTLLRLMNLGADPLMLYLHYCTTAKAQSKANGKYINSAYATSDYCMKGLNLSKDRFHNAKNLLLDNKFIEDYVPRDEKGKVKKHYIKIHYLLKNSVNMDSFSEIHQYENLEGGKPRELNNLSVENTEPNTINENLNTMNKNINVKNKKENIINTTTAPITDKKSTEIEVVTDEEKNALQVVGELDKLLPFTQKKLLNLKKKDQKAYWERINGIIFWINKGKTAEDFIQLAVKLSKEDWINQIHLMTLITYMGITRNNDQPKVAFYS